MNGFQRRSLGAAIGSLVLLLGAFAFQYIGGMAPCPLCITQRWPHAVAIALAVLIVLLPVRFFALLGAGAMFVGAGVAAWHTGIERGWWKGPESCTAPDASNLSSGELLDRLMQTPPVLCDQVAWEMFGLSMASWNGLASLILGFLWLRAYASSSASQ